MKIFSPHIHNKITLNQIPNKVSFGVTNRNYNLDNDYYINTSMGTYTLMFRNDIDWFELAKKEQELFKDKDKVNMIQFASSSGAEAYTKIISMLEANTPEKVKKFFPIKAYDIDPVIVDVAKSGFINFDKQEKNDFYRYNLDILKYFTPHTEKLDLNCGDFKAPQKTYSAKNILTDNVDFQKGDMFKLANEIEDNSNTIVLCRNSLAYFNRNLQEKFIRAIASKLKENSLFIVGDFDADFGILPLLKKYRFKEIMKNVYQKIDNSSEPIEIKEEKKEIPFFARLKAHLDATN